MILEILVYIFACFGVLVLSYFVFSKLFFKSSTNDTVMVIDGLKTMLKYEQERVIDLKRDVKILESDLKYKDVMLNNAKQKIDSYEKIGCRIFGIRLDIIHDGGIGENSLFNDLARDFLAGLIRDQVFNSINNLDILKISPDKLPLIMPGYDLQKPPDGQTEHIKSKIGYTVSMCKYFLSPKESVGAS